MARSASASRGSRFPDDIIARAVRWDRRFRLPDAELAELFAERGVHVDPSTSFEWVQPVTPLSRDAARRHRRRVGDQWRIAETDSRIAGRGWDAFRAIAEDGQVIDVSVSPTRDPTAATAFVTRAIKSPEVTPSVATTDRAPLSPPAFAALLPEVEPIKGKLVHQRIERDHHQLNGRTRSMRGFQTLPYAHVVCEGHGVMRNLRGGFHNLASPVDERRLPDAPHLVRAWDELTLSLAAV